MMLLLSWLLACSGADPAAPQPVRSRVDAVKAVPKAVDLDAFCDSQPDPPIELVLPPLDGPAPADGPGWRWVNVWATWCGPCVAEMPMLAGWRDQLVEKGVAVELVFLSVDDERAKVDRFVKQHPEARGGVRIADVDELEPWLPKVGLDPGVVLPVNLFADPSGNIRCIRTGAVSDHDLAAVEALLAG
jgi:thiol-disulfide isomerase/thioredoxin